MARTDPRIEDLAADWMSRRDAGFSQEEQSRFRAWLGADPRHAAAVAEIEAAMAVLTRPHRFGRADVVLRDLAARRDRRLRRALLQSGLGLAAAAGLAIVVVHSHRSPATVHLTAKPAAAIAASSQPRRQVLEDGSIMYLENGSEARAAYDPGLRRVRVSRGTVEFVVAKNPARPFVVTAGVVEVRAVGTAFSVSYESNLVDVHVDEGRVAVQHARVDAAPAASLPAPIYLVAGSRLQVRSDEATPGPLRITYLSDSTPDRAASVRGQLTEFSGTPLIEAVDSFNRQNEIKLSLGDPSLAGLRISGDFPSDDPDGFARVLESSLGIQAVHRSSREIVLQPSP